MPLTTSGLPISRHREAMPALNCTGHRHAGHPRSRRCFIGSGLLIAAGGALAACASLDADQPRGVADALRFGQNAKPGGLDPAKFGPLEQTLLAYDPLIYSAPDGSYQPRIAESWRYIGTGNKTFELKLRPGVVFSDGTPCDAAAVRANIDYYRTAPGSQAVLFLKPVANIVEVDDLTVRLELSEPHPLLPTIFTQQYWAGNLISPAAIANPEKLATQSYGAGPYVLVPGETVAGDHYTYTPSSTYWNPSGVHYRRVVTKVLTNANTALAALKTNQVDAIEAFYDTVGGAKSAGMQIVSSPSLISGLVLLDRGGRLSKPLADIRVRQALNHAVDRAKLARALFGEYGTPTDQIAPQGRDGWNDTEFYSYDPGRARQLLADAGFPEGFSLPVLTPSAPFATNMVQAIASELAKIGVRLEITASTTDSAVSGKWPASFLGWGLPPVYLQGRLLWLPDAILNPFQSADAEVQALDAEAAAADEGARADLDRKIVRRIAELGWFLPVCLMPEFLFTRPTVAVDAIAGQQIPSIDSWHPAR